MRSRIVLRSLVFVAVIAGSVVALVATGALPGHGAGAAEACSGVQIKPGQDLDAIVNRDSNARATTFCVQASASGTTYNVDKMIYVGPGDKILGPPGQIVTRGPASYGVPTAKIRGGASMEKVIQLNGSNNRLAWLDVSGGQTGIAAGQSNASTRLEYLAVHDTQRTGIGNMRGRLLHSNLYANGTDPRWWGHSASAVKGVDEYEAAFNYVHDNPANGLWCDVGCRDEGSAMPNGFWAHDNLVVGNGRWGVRYESAPLLRDGQRAGGSSALVERNEIHANGRSGGFGGAAMWDAQNATFRNNSFGAKSIAGTSYASNADRRAIRFFDSGKASRTDLYNGDAVTNALGGERIEGCEKPDAVVACSGNR